MTDPIMDEQFDLLRTRVEAEIEVPAVILVSSACAGDGKSVAAYGLASSFAASDYRTVLVDANHFAPTIADDWAPTSLEQFTGGEPRNFARPTVERKFSAICFAKDSLRRNVSRVALSRALEILRDAYQIVVVDASPLGESNLAMMLARQADGIVLTVRKGRSIKRADRELVSVIDASDVPTIGTIAISPKTISAFKANVARRGSSVQTLLPVETQARARTAVG